MSLHRARAVRAVLAGGLAAGTLDILAALVVYGLRGARPPAALGLVLHFFIATVAAAYYVASRKLDLCVGLPIALAVRHYRDRA